MVKGLLLTILTATLALSPAMASRNNDFNETPRLHKPNNRTNHPENATVSVLMGTSEENPSRKFIYGIHREMWAVMRERAEKGEFLFSKGPDQCFVIGTQPSTDPHATIDVYREFKGGVIDKKLGDIFAQPLKRSLELFRNLPSVEDLQEKESPCIENNAVRFMSRNLILIARFVSLNGEPRVTHYRTGDIHKLLNEKNSLESVTIVLELCEGKPIEGRTFLDYATDMLQKNITGNEQKKTVFVRQNNYESRLLHLSLLKLKAVEQRDYEAYMQIGNRQLLRNIEPEGFVSLVNLFKRLQSNIFPDDQHHFIYFDRVFMGGMQKLADRKLKHVAKQNTNRGTPPNKVISPKFYNSSHRFGFAIPSGQELDFTIRKKVREEDIASIDAIFTQKNLQILDLSNNALEIIPDQIGMLKELRMLFLDNNNLRTLPWAHILALDNLRYLDISDSPIDASCPEITMLVGRGCEVVTEKKVY